MTSQQTCSLFLRRTSIGLSLLYHNFLLLSNTTPFSFAPLCPFSRAPMPSLEWAGDITYRENANGTHIFLGGRYRIATKNRWHLQLGRDGPVFCCCCDQSRLARTQGGRRDQLRAPPEQAIWLGWPDDPHKATA